MTVVSKSWSVPVIGLCVAIPGILLAATSSVLALAIGGLMLYGLAGVASKRVLLVGFGTEVQELA